VETTIENAISTPGAVLAFQMTSAIADESTNVVDFELLSLTITGGGFGVPERLQWSLRQSVLCSVVAANQLPDPLDSVELAPFAGNVGNGAVAGIGDWGGDCVHGYDVNSASATTIGELCSGFKKKDCK
jgi:hypothetical protein